MIPIEAQFYDLLVMILLGVIMGIFFDVYRELRNTFRFKKMTTNLWDLLVWMVLVVIAFAVLLYINYGDVRFYIFIGMAAGMLLYFSLLSRKSRRIIQTALFIFFRVLAALWLVFRIPLTIVQKILTFPANLISLLLLKTIRPVLKKFKALAGRFKGNKGSKED